MKLVASTLCAAALVAAASVPAKADVQVGLLSCAVAPSVSYIIGSQKELHCVYQPAKGRSVRYVGHITRIGLDVGFTTGGTIAWSVWSASRPGPGALVGQFVGASAEATIAAGLSANALVGGSNNSITLQPLSVGVQGGLAVALAASGVQLEAVPTHRRKRSH